MSGWSRFVDFCISVYYFPGIIKVGRFLKKTGPTTAAEQAFLYFMSRDIPAKGDILEIGCLKGASSVLLAAGNELSRRKSNLWLVDPCPLPSKAEFVNFLMKHNLAANARLIDKTSEEARKIINEKFRFIFVDGSHEYEFVRKDIVLWQDCLREGGIMAFHDRESRGVSRAINELIRQSDKFTVLGTMGSILYASKGNFGNQDLIYRFRKNNRAREKCLTIARRLRLKN
jgi:predicted O-methyltransferase YrrM